MLIGNIHQWKMGGYNLIW